MCLISKWNFPKKAEIDIVCYKVLMKKYDQYYAPYVYNEVDITKPYNAEGKSFSFNYSKRREKSVGYIHTVNTIASTRYMINNVDRRTVVFECIIPKGTKYHCSKFDDGYCSKQIIFKRKMPDYLFYR